ncbi:phosphohydrolase [Desulfopila inferna]|uniref:phosphohydrolase n=1 Tax=Desulfopila inferna TaxID=468528 RepID=UPI001962AB53|nr:phosphohydrolase [Desulfopila inferna]MBM9602813.1 phosphohydrolase [Desulfopila inferna]
MKCPGQDTQYWNEDAIYEVKCPECQAMVEFYKDDTTRKCHHCQHRFVNPKMDFGCATYCQFAEQCLGTLPEEFVMQQDNLLKDKVAVEMKRYFKNDFKSIGFAMKVANLAERIGRATEGANLAAVLCSAYLLNIGQRLAEQTGSTSKKDLEREGPAVASEILHRLRANEELISQVCNIVGKAMPPAADDNDIAHRIVNDAYQVARLDLELKNGKVTSADFEKRLESIFSEKGREEATAVFAAVAS